MNMLLPSTDYNIDEQSLLESLEPTREDIELELDQQYWQEFDQQNERLILSMPNLQAYRVA